MSTLSCLCVSERRAWPGCVLRAHVSRAAPALCGAVLRLQGGEPEPHGIAGPLSTAVCRRCRVPARQAVL